MRTSNVKSMNARQKSKFRNAIRSITIEWERSEVDVVLKATGMLAGGISTSTLNAMGNPYGRNNAVTEVRRNKMGKKPRKFRVTLGGAVVPLLPINRQTGELMNSMRIVRRGKGDNRTRYLFFTAPYSKYALAQYGTKSTIPRGFWGELSKFNRESKRSFMKQARRLK